MPHKYLRSFRLSGYEFTIRGTYQHCHITPYLLLYNYHRLNYPNRSFKMFAASVRRVLILLAALIAVSEGYTILGILPTAAKSHFIIGHSFMKGLANAGHDVYVISPFPLKKPIPNYHDVDISSILNEPAGEYIVREGYQDITYSYTYYCTNKMPVVHVVIMFLKNDLRQ